MKDINKFENVEYYRELKVIKKSLEYKICLAIDPEEKEKLKKEMYNIKLHLKILENALHYLKIKDEYDVIYLTYFKEGWQFKNTDDIAEELHMSTYSVYKHKNLAKKKIEQYFKRLDVVDREIVDIKEQLELNRKRFKVRKVNAAQIGFKFLMPGNNIKC